MQMKSPNFLIGGCAASGTSFLSAILLQHPRVYLPSEMRPEPHFFYKSWEYEKGWDYYLTRWFTQVPEHCVAVGERSSSYLYGGRRVAQKMARHVPDLKHVFVIRNPIERTWANYRYTVLEGLEELSFDDALHQEHDRVRSAKGRWAEIQPHDYTGRGFYGRQLSEFMEFFPKSQIMVMKSEELAKDPAGSVEKLLHFLEVPSESWQFELPSTYTSMSVNSPVKQVELRSALGTRFDELIELLRIGGVDAELPCSRHERPLVEELRQNLAVTKLDMSLESRTYLRSIFSDDIALLRDLVDFDVAGWLN